MTHNPRPSVDSKILSLLGYGFNHSIESTFTQGSCRTMFVFLSLISVWRKAVHGFSSRKSGKHRVHSSVSLRGKPPLPSTFVYPQQKRGRGEHSHPLLSAGMMCTLHRTASPITEATTRPQGPPKPQEKQGKCRFILGNHVPSKPSITLDREDNKSGSVSLTHSEKE